MPIHDDLAPFYKEVLHPRRPRQQKRTRIPIAGRFERMHVPDGHICAPALLQHPAIVAAKHFGPATGGNAQGFPWAHRVGTATHTRHKHRLARLGDKAARVI